MNRKRGRSNIAFFSAAALLTMAGVAAAAPTAAALRKIDPNFFRATRTGVGSTTSRAHAPKRAAAMIELDHVATAADFARLRAAGVEVVVANGKPIAYDRFVAVRLDEKAATTVAPFTDLRRISLSSHPSRLPLDHSAELIRLDDARGSQPAMERLTGKGITIGDEDSLVDVFEPAFFRGDGGYYDWIDVDKDGVLTPGKDAIDLNANGAVDAGEVAVAIEMQPLDEYQQNVVTAVRPAGFDPGIDWLYLDTNANGARDYGPDAGFDETTPAYGEPLFTPDDVNRNGKIDVGERVVRLGTSKFKAIRVSVDYGTKVDSSFSRGTDIIKTPTDITHGKLYGFADAFHATGVSTILAGDLPLVGRRWVGMAPDADLIVSFDVESTGDGLPAHGVTWLLQQKPDVMLHELALWADVPLDGSDELSALIDTSVTKDNVTETCPTGDQGSALKHARSAIAASGTTTLPFDVPAVTLGGAGPLTYVAVSLNVTGGDLGASSFIEPGGGTIAISPNGNGNLDGGAMYYFTEETTPRGTRFWNLILYAQTSPATLATGTWKLQLGAGAAPIVVDSYIEDDKSSWAIGAAWDKSVASEAFTVGVPSVADHCIAVGAAPNHVGDDADPEYDLGFYVEYNVPAGYEETQNQVRAYSPRGPRIDGVQKPDILAPDNPWVALPHLTDSTSAYGSYAVFGGTSGASPHVTGVAALLAQAGIRGDAARDAIRAGAATDGAVGALPNGDYGYGRLDAAKALGVKTDGVTPSVTLSANPSTLAFGQQAQLTAAVSGGDDLQIEFDDDYDGTWDTPYSAAAPRSVTSDHAGLRHFKVRVKNSSGRIAESVASIMFTDPSASGGGDGGGGCGCTTSSNLPSFGGSALIGFVGLGLLRKKRRKTGI